MATNNETLKRARDEPSDDAPAAERARSPGATPLCVPLVYQEGKEVLAISVWFPGLVVDQAKRKIIFEGLRGKDKNEWVDFLQSADDYVAHDPEDFLLPKEFEGMKSSDLGVVCADDCFFCFDNTTDTAGQ